MVQEKYWSFQDLGFVGVEVVGFLSLGLPGVVTWDLEDDSRASTSQILA